jgi:sodium-coupled monocarboxylate transporter 8/12
MTIFLGLAISYMTKKDEAPIDKSLISPVSHFLLLGMRTMYRYC